MVLNPQRVQPHSLRALPDCDDISPAWHIRAPAPFGNRQFPTHFEGGATDDILLMGYVVSCTVHELQPPTTVATAVVANRANPRSTSNCPSRTTPSRRSRCCSTV